MFPFAALGAGLGRFAEDYRQQQESALRQMQARMQMQQMQRQQQEKQQSDQAASMLFGGILGGGLGDTQIQPIGGQPAAPSPTRAPDMGGGMRAGGALPGGADPRGLVPYIKETASKYGVDPNVATAVYRSEGLGNPVGDKGTSFGAPQLHVGGGLGDEFQKETGLDPRNWQQNERAMIDWSLRNVSRTGWTPYHGAARVGIGPRQGIGGPAAPSGGTAAGPDQMAGGGVPATLASPAAAQQPAADPGAPVQQEVQQAVQRAAQTIPPPLFGRVGLQALAQQIEKANPGADPVVKMMALEHAQKLLAPDAKLQWEMYKQQHDESFQKEMALFRHRLQVDDPTSAKLLQDPAGNLFEHRPGQPIPEGARLPTPGSSASRGSKNVEIVGSDGTKIFAGAAHQDPTGRWVSDKDQKPLEIPDDADIRIAGTGGGRQAATQMNRVVNAGNLLSAELGNMMSLPAMSTSSIFQGIESAPARDLGAALQRSLAAKITPEAATDLSTTFQGVARAVAALETTGAATGLVGLAEQAKVYQPMPTDTVGNVMRKMATLRQILERGLQSASAAKDVTPDQKKLFDGIKAEVAQSVPFTVEDVTKLQRGDKETYKQLFERRMKEKAEAAPAGAAGEALPLEPAYASMPDGSAFEDPARPGGLWVKRGNTRVWTPGATVTQPVAEAPIPPAQ